MNSTTNWFNSDATSAYQQDLYRAATQARLVSQVSGRSHVVRLYHASMAALGGRMILWGTHLQKRAGLRVIVQPKVKTV
jgi:hypothetical protein